MDTAFHVCAGEPGALLLADEIPEGVSGMKLSLGLIVQENKLPIGKVLLMVVPKNQDLPVIASPLARSILFHTRRLLATGTLRSRRTLAPGRDLLGKSCRGRTLLAMTRKTFVEMR